MQSGGDFGPFKVTQSTELSTASVDKETLVSDALVRPSPALLRLRSRLLFETERNP